MNLVKISSINIWDEQTTFNQLIAEPSVTKTFVEGNIYRCSSSGYFRANATFVSATASSITYKSDYSGYGFGKAIRVKPNTAYYVKSTFNNNAMRIAVGYYTENGVIISSDVKSANVSEATFTTPANATWAIFMSWCGDSSSNVTWSDIQVCLNSEAEKTIYHPHWVLGLNNGNAITCDLSAMLPSGIGVVDLGTLNWSKGSQYNAMNVAVSGFAPPMSNGMATLCAEGYGIDSSGNVWGAVRDKSMGLSANGGALWMYDSRYTDAQSFKQAMQGVLLFYRKSS